MNEQPPRPTLEELAEQTRQQNAKDGIGLRCPKCHCRDTRVVTTWHDVEGEQTKRARICRNCGYKITTSETIF